MLIPAKLSKVIVLENKAFHTIMIEEKTGPRHFPIEIGLFEAIALTRKVESGAEAPRPLTHDLLLNTISAMGGKVSEVRIVELSGGTYYARLVLETDEGPVEIDARPSDALVLAASEKCDLYVEESVFEATTRSA